MEKIIKELKEIWDSEENALKHCGGTCASMNLRKSFDLIKEIENYNKHPDYKKILDHLITMREVWRNVLIKHNSNKHKFIEYDINTGFPVKK